MHGSMHDHGHGHGLSRLYRAEGRRRLQLALLLAVTYMAAELVGGLLTGSLALLADAAHMLTDVAALAFSLFALWAATRPADKRRTYGYYRTEILAALLNGAVLIALSGFIVYEAIDRFREPPVVLGGPMMAIAAGGLLVNLAMLWILRAGRAHSLNVQGAWLHVLSDALGSVGALAAGAAVTFLGWTYADPLASIVIAVLVIASTFGLLRESVSVLMEAAPGHIDVDEVHTALLGIDAVRSVHDLHVWTISSGLVSLSAHVAVTGERSHGAVLGDARALLLERFDIRHVTIQIELDDQPECHPTCPL